MVHCKHYHWYAGNYIDPPEEWCDKYDTADCESCQLLEELEDDEYERKMLSGV